MSFFSFVYERGSAHSKRLHKNLPRPSSNDKLCSPRLSSSLLFSPLLSLSLLFSPLLSSLFYLAGQAMQDASQHPGGKAGEARQGSSGVLRALPRWLYGCPRATVRGRRPPGLQQRPLATPRRTSSAKTDAHRAWWALFGRLLFERKWLWL